MIETLRGTKKSKKDRGKKKDITHLDPKVIDDRIKELKQQMKEAAKDLRFEDAAKIRDEIKALNEARLVL